MAGGAVVGAFSGAIGGAIGGACEGGRRQGACAAAGPVGRYTAARGDVLPATWRAGSAGCSVKQRDE
eukprot:gene36254-20267_t